MTKKADYYLSKIDQYNEEEFQSQYENDLKTLAQKFAKDIQKNGGTVDDAILDMCIIVTQTLTKLNVSNSKKALLDLLK